MTATLSGTPVLHTARLTLRAPKMADWDTWLAFTRDDRSHFIRGGQPMDLRTAWRAFAHVTGMWALRGFGSFVFCRQGSDDPLGMTGPWFPMEYDEPELGWSVWQAAAEGRGLAAEAAARARDFAFADLGWTTAVSYIDRANARSIALAGRLGARPDAAAISPHPGEDVLVYRHPQPSPPVAP
jgi:RimJ/RimL family protein N-acetyltransferase